jgi:hypothetical protein
VTASVVCTEVAGGAYLHWLGPGEDVGPNALVKLAAALEARPEADVAVAGAVHGTTFVAARVSDDPLLDLLAGAPYPPPAAAYLIRARAAEREWSAEPEPWGAREYMTRLALRGARFISVDRGFVRAPALVEDNDVEVARTTFARLQAAATGSAVVQANHRRLLEQPWALWRIGSSVVQASLRTRALGAVGTLVGQELARSTGSRTIEGWTTYLRARNPRLERIVLGARDAVESLAADGLLVAEGA